VRTAAIATNRRANPITRVACGTARGVSNSAGWARNTLGAVTAAESGQLKATAPLSATLLAQYCDWVGPRRPASRPQARDGGSRRHGRERHRKSRRVSRIHVKEQRTKQSRERDSASRAARHSTRGQQQAAAEDVPEQARWISPERQPERQLARILGHIE